MIEIANRDRTGIRSGGCLKNDTQPADSVIRQHEQLVAAAGRDRQIAERIVVEEPCRKRLHRGRSGQHDRLRHRCKRITDTRRFVNQHDRLLSRSNRLRPREDHLRRTVLVEIHDQPRCDVQPGPGRDLLVQHKINRPRWGDGAHALRDSAHALRDSQQIIAWLANPFQQEPSIALRLNRELTPGGRLDQRHSRHHAHFGQIANAVLVAVLEDTATNGTQSSLERTDVELIGHAAILRT